MIKYFLNTVLILFFTSCGCRDTECPDTDFGIYDNHYPNDFVSFENEFGDLINIELEEGGYIAEETKGDGLFGCRPCNSSYSQEGGIIRNGIQLDFNYYVSFSDSPSDEMDLEQFSISFEQYRIDFYPENETNPGNNIDEPTVNGNTNISPLIQDYELRENQNITNCFIVEYNSQYTQIDTLIYSRDVGLIEFNLQDTTWKRVF